MAPPCSLHPTTLALLLLLLLLLLPAGLLLLLLLLGCWLIQPCVPVGKCHL
jgi:hypothetical protein